jgi:hypothetical protein
LDSNRQRIMKWQEPWQSFFSFLKFLMIKNAQGREGLTAGRIQNKCSYKTYDQKKYFR